MPQAQTFWRRWLHRPQRIWLRRALFQIHLWTGIGAALYVFVVSISGSALVFRREIETQRLHRIIVSKGSGRALSPNQLQERVHREYPTAEVVSAFEPRPDQPVAIILARGDKTFERLFDPYTGADLGAPFSQVNRVLAWLADLHDNLLAGFTGRTVNGFGSMLVVLLSLTGAAIWWPGSKNWRRSTRILWTARFPRFNWDLHSAVGLWCYLFVLLWGVSGICLCFPGVLDFLLGVRLSIFLTRLHFGRFNTVTEAIWTVLGLAPAILAATGILMWWNRVLKKKFPASRRRVPATRRIDAVAK